jgi:hypothetical protein
VLNTKTYQLYFHVEVYQKHQEKVFYSQNINSMSVQVHKLLLLIMVFVKVKIIKVKEHIAKMVKLEKKLLMHQIVKEIQLQML